MPDRGYEVTLKSSYPVFLRQCELTLGNRNSQFT